MSAVVIINQGISNTPASVNPCLNYNHLFKVEWDTAVAPITYPLNLNFYVGDISDPNSINKTITSGDQTGTDGTKLIFDVSFELTRVGSTRSVIIFNATGTQFDTISFQSLSAWEILSVNVSTDINNFGTLSVQTVSSNFGGPLGIEISVDDINYFDTNVITGLIPDDYILYVRDAYGCTKTRNITVINEPSFEVYNDFKFVSLLNPVPFTEVNNLRASFGNTPSYKVDHNPLSLNNKYEFKQADPLDINTSVSPLNFQFRSNYEVNKAFILNCGEVVSELTVNKRSANLNQRDNRDARFYFENGFLYAYFDGTGNIYDNDGGIIGNNDLNGSLLFDQVAGELLSIESLGIIEILEIVNVDGIGQVMRLNFTQPVGSTYLIVTTYYNYDNFDVYEFDFNLSLDTNDYQIVIVNNSTAQFDENNPLANATYISEVISIVEEFSKPMFKFVWKNSENNQFSWDTGIECYNYMPKSFDPEFQPKDENDIYTTDTTSFMLESDVYDIFLFVIERVSQITARQLMMIASNDYLKIDDNFYVKEETPEILRLGVSNAYNITLTLQLASNYNSNSREGLTRNRNLVDTGGFLRIR